MAYVFGFPKDVTDLISGMRDWRWEMVRDGGKTPSASCMNPCPPHGIGEMITTNMEPGKEYLTTCCMPEFYDWGTYCVPHWEYQPGSRGSIPSSWGAPAPCTIKLDVCPWCLMAKLRFAYMPLIIFTIYSGMPNLRNATINACGSTLSKAFDQSKKAIEREVSLPSHQLIV